jgi:hypothetical protein
MLCKSQPQQLIALTLQEKPAIWRKEFYPAGYPFSFVSFRCWRVASYSPKTPTCPALRRGWHLRMA